MRATLFSGCLLLATALPATEPLTTAERSDYTHTSLHAEVVEVLHAVARRSPLLALASLGTSAEGRDIPLVILSQERVRTAAELRATGKPAVLVMAGIHAGEVEGKEACQRLVREVALGDLAHLLEHQVVLVLPLFNPDGNEKLGRNRRDRGPELAGVRHNGQYLDLNRDYTKLESPEVSALVRLLAEWDPVLVLDMHTTNGSHHREPVTYATGSNPNAAPALADYMWGTLFPEVARKLHESGWQSVPYGNFADRERPERGWLNDSVEARYGSNYVALRNRLSLLDESYSYADFRTRVLSSFGLVKAVLEHTGANAARIQALVRQLDRETRDSYPREAFVPDWTLEPLFDVTVHGFEHTRIELTPEERVRFPWLQGFRLQPTATERDYTMPYLARAVARSRVPLPAGYAVLPGFEEVVGKLRAHGLALERLLEPARVAAERFALAGVEPARDLYQGHVLLTLAGRYVAEEAVELPAGTVWVDLRQPLARLAPVLLEPGSVDGLAAFGLFSRSLVRQWSAEPGLYPVLRLRERPPVATRVLPEPPPPPAQ